MQKGPKPVFIRKHDAPSPSTARGAACLPEPPAPAAAQNQNLNPNLNPDFISGQVENTLAHKTARLVETHPQDAVRVLRGWLYQD